MFDRLLEFLKKLPVTGQKDRIEGFAQSDPRLAAAALLIHIMDVDGNRHESERQRLANVLSQAYGLKGEELKRLMKAAEIADQEAIDLYSFTSVLKRHLDTQARLDFIALMWEMVYADGEVHELEDNVMWRVAELIGISGPERIAIKHRVAERYRDGFPSINAANP